MAICSKCGAQLFETSKFCPECGTPVLEVSTDTNKTGDIYSAFENADDENSTAIFQGIDPSEISPDETAEILEAAAEKALEDIPEIVKIEGVDIHTEKPGEIPSELPEAAEAPEAPKTPEAPKAETSEAEAPKAEKREEKNEPEKKPEKEAPAKDDFSDMGAYVADSSEFKEMAEEVPRKKKGGKTGAVIIAAVVIVAAVGAGVYFMGGHNSAQPAVDTTVTVTEAAVTEVAVDNESTPDSEISDTEVSVPETTVTSETTAEVTTVTDTEETTESETTEAVTEAVSMKTAEEFAAGIEITPEHKTAAENEASCTISLAAEGLSADMLSEGGLLVVSYTAKVQTGTIPVTVYMTVTVGGTDIDVVASSSGDGVAVFEFANMASAAAAKGFSAADIDSISFKGTGAGVEVTSITVMKG